MAERRTNRKTVIASLVRSHKVKTQGELIELLRDEGFAVTQATVSRDVADLGLVKDEQGTYVLSEDRRFKLLVKSQATEVRRAFNQVIILTGPGAAQGIAWAIDTADFDGVLGTIAGDDTILVITQDEDAGKEFQQFLQRLMD